MKAYEVSKGEFVTLTDEDFDAARVEGGHSITIHDFVPADQIDPIYFERTYYLGPEEGAGEAIYALLAQAMAESGLAAVATYVRSDRENLACLRVRDGVITLERMFFDDEVRSSEGIAPSAAKVDKRQLEMARDLIGAYTAEFDVSKYQDTYRERLLEVIERKRQGKTTKPKAVSTEEKPPRSDGRAHRVARPGAGGQEAGGQEQEQHGLEGVVAVAPQGGGVPAQDRLTAAGMLAA